MSIKSKIAGLFTGGIMTAVETGADIVERWVPNAVNKHEMAVAIDQNIEASVNNARQHDTSLANIPGWLNGLVNAVNRLIRPCVTVGLIGGVVGLWPLPVTDAIDPVILGFTEMVLIFWFGGRALFKDLPSLIKYVQVRKG